MNPARYAKAIVSALVAGLGTLATALADDGIEAAEWVWVAIAFLTALGAVFAVPNQAADPVDELADHDRRVQRADLDERLHEPPSPSGAPISKSGSGYTGLSLSSRAEDDPSHEPGEHRRRDPDLP